MVFTRQTTVTFSTPQLRQKRETMSSDNAIFWPSYWFRAVQVTTSKASKINTELFLSREELVFIWPCYENIHLAGKAYLNINYMFMCFTYMFPLCNPCNSFSFCLMHITKCRTSWRCTPPWSRNQWSRHTSYSHFTAWFIFLIILKRLRVFVIIFWSETEHEKSSLISKVT